MNKLSFLLLFTSLQCLAQDVYKTYPAGSTASVALFPYFTNYKIQALSLNSAVDTAYLRTFTIDGQGNTIAATNLRKYTPRQVDRVFGMDGTFVVGTATTTQLRLRKYNASGSQLWSRNTAFSSLLTPTVAKVATNLVGDYFIFGSADESTTADFVPRVLLAKYNASGVKQWELKTESLAGVTGSFSFSGGEIFPTAEGGCYLSYNATTSDKKMIMRISPTGAMVWKKEIACCQTFVSTGVNTVNDNLFLSLLTPSAGPSPITCTFLELESSTGNTLKNIVLNTLLSAPQSVRVQVMFPIPTGGVVLAGLEQAAFGGPLLSFIATLDATGALTGKKNVNVNGTFMSGFVEGDNILLAGKTTGGDVFYFKTAKPTLAQCNLSAVLSQTAPCSDNGTPDVASDDTYSFFATVNQNGPCGSGWTGGGAPVNAGAYGTNYNFGPYLISSGNKTLTFADVSNPASTVSVTVNAPAPCSFPNVSCTANLLANGDFDQGVANWGSGFTEVRHANSTLCSGNNYAVLQSQNSKSLSQTLTATPGAAYTLRVRANIQTMTSMSAIVGLRFKNGAVVLDSVVAAYGGFDENWGTFPDITGICTYKDITLSKTAPAGATQVEVYGQHRGQFSPTALSLFMLDGFCLTASGGGPSGCANNLLQNAGFENGLTGWSGNGEIVTAGVNSGTNAIRVCTSGQTARQTIPAVAGKSYTLNGYARKEAGTNMFIFVKFLSSSWAPLLFTYSNTAYTTNWAAIEPLTLTAPAGTAWVEVSVLQNGGTGCVYADDLCFTEGSGSSSAITLNCPADKTFDVLYQSGNTGSPCPAGVWSLVTLPTATTTCASGGVAVTFDSYTVLNGDITLQNGTAEPTCTGIRVLGSGTAQVTLKATDACGNSTTCTFKITQTIYYPSVAFSSCPQPITVVAAAGATGAVVTYPAPVVTVNNCGSAGSVQTIALTSNYLLNGLPSGSTFPVGNTTVAYSYYCGQVGNVCTFVVTVLPGGSNQPDLQLENLALGANSIAAGSVLNYTFALKNTGAGAAAGNFNIKAYISTDNTLSANDVQDGTVPTGNLAANTVIPAVNGATTLPATLAAGLYYLILKVDADNQIAESNENNNVLASASAFTVVAGGGGTPNCPVQSDYPWEDWIGGVKIGTVEKTSGKSAFSNFTATTFTLSKTAANSLTLTSAYSYTTYDEYWRIWIDYNHDNIYQSTEKAFEGILSKPANGVASKTLTGAITVPASALSGTAKMRVVMRRGAYGEACGAIPFGEVEDYSVSIPVNFVAGDDRNVFEKIETPGFTLYPNPATQMVTLDLGDWTGKSVTVALLDVHGTIALEKSFQAGPAEVINLSTYDPGMYILRLSTEGARPVVRRLVIGD